MTREALDALAKFTGDLIMQILNSLLACAVLAVPFSAAETPGPSTGAEKQPAASSNTRATKSSLSTVDGGSKSAPGTAAATTLQRRDRDDGTKSYKGCKRHPNGEYWTCIDWICKDGVVKKGNCWPGTVTQVPDSEMNGGYAVGRGTIVAKPKPGATLSSAKQGKLRACLPNQDTNGVTCMEWSCPDGAGTVACMRVGVTTKTSGAKK